MKRLAALSLCSALLLVPACAPSSGGSGSIFGQAGVTVALTDAASDELSSFTVELESFRIDKASGAVVGVLPSPVTVDLVRLQDLSQVLGVMPVPPGYYIGGEVTFDFTGAVAVIEGSATPAAILDANGAPLTGQIDLPLSFGSKPLQAAIGKHKLLELDFDLDQSVMVDAFANTVSVEPVMVMRVDPTSPKQLVVFGDLVEVNTVDSVFAVELQTLAGAPLGTVELDAGPLTAYQIDGVPSLGATGLAALEAVGAGTWVQIYGSVDPTNLCLRAVYVEAGTGTYNGGSDIVEGHVIARSSGAGTSATLTVHGHSNNATHTAFLFNAQFTVTTDFANTKVLKRGGIQALSLDDVNIGQRVRLFGALAGTALDVSAARDVVRLQPTAAWGYANAAPASGVLSVDLARVGPIPAGLFTWADAGLNPPDPSDFQVDVASLTGGLGIAAGTAVRARGFFAPLDDPGEDMDALAVLNLDSAPSLLFVRDQAGVGLSLLVTPTPTEVQLDFTGSAVPGEAAVIARGFVGTQPLPSPATIRPPASGLTIYVIKDKVLGSTGLYLTFTEFSAALSAALAQGASVTQVAAIGPYDAGTNAIESPLASVCLN